jgi:hypothetical protein
MINDNDIGINSIYRWPTVRSKSWLIDFLKSAWKDDNIMAVIAIGSSVRPEVPSTDLDIIVILKEPTKLKLKPPIEIDTRTYIALEVSDLISKGHDLLGWTVKYGRILFQRENFWSAIIEKWQDKLPLPSAEAAIKRAEDAFRRMASMFEIGDSDAAHEQAISYVTHLARVELLRNGIYPASRPELPGQLRAIECFELAALLEQLIVHKNKNLKQISQLIGSHHKSDDLLTFSKQILS